MAENHWIVIMCVCEYKKEEIHEILGTQKYKSKQAVLIQWKSLFQGLANEVMVGRHPQGFECGPSLGFKADNSQQDYYQPSVHYQQQPGSKYTSIQGTLLLIID